MEFNKELFAAQVRAGRAELDMSQEAFAKEVGVSTDAVVKYERGEAISPALRHFFLVFSQVNNHFLSDNVLPRLVELGEIGQSLTCESILTSPIKFLSWTVLGDKKGTPERAPFGVALLVRERITAR